MAVNKWRLVLKDVEIPAKPGGVWTLVTDSVEGYARLKLEAEGLWSYSANRNHTCGPDGDLCSEVDGARNLLSKAPTGSLIGKLGGSSAGSDDGYVFVVGAVCIIEPGTADRGSTTPIPKGPLYLTINDRRDGLHDNDGTMKVSVFDGTQP
jgi:hypothetical protein